MTHLMHWYSTSLKFVLCCLCFPCGNFMWNCAGSAPMGAVVWPKKWLLCANCVDSVDRRLVEVGLNWNTSQYLMVQFSGHRRQWLHLEEQSKDLFWPKLDTYRRKHPNSPSFCWSMRGASFRIQTTLVWATLHSFASNVPHQNGCDRWRRWCNGCSIGGIAKGCADGWASGSTFGSHFWLLHRWPADFYSVSMGSRVAASRIWWMFVSPFVWDIRASATPMGSWWPMHCGVPCWIVAFDYKRCASNRKWTFCPRQLCAAISVRCTDTPAPIERWKFASLVPICGWRWRRARGIRLAAAAERVTCAHNWPRDRGICRPACPPPSSVWWARSCTRTSSPWPWPREMCMRGPFGCPHQRWT